MKKMSLLIIIFSITSCDFLDNRPKAIRDMEKKMKGLDDDTLLGPDKNGDGVRDDIEYWIKNSSTIKTNDIRKAALLYAKSSRQGLALVSNRKSSVENTYERIVLSSCLSLVMPRGWRERDKVFKPLHEYMYNTEERLKTNLLVDANFAGEGGAIHKFANEACPFKLEGKYRERRKE